MANKTYTSDEKRNLLLTACNNYNAYLNKLKRELSKNPVSQQANEPNKKTLSRLEIVNTKLERMANLVKILSNPSSYRDGGECLNQFTIHFNIDRATISQRNDSYIATFLKVVAAILTAGAAVGFGVCRFGIWKGTGNRFCNTAEAINATPIDDANLKSSEYDGL